MKKLNYLIFGILILCSFFAFVNFSLVTDSVTPVWSTGANILKKVRAGNTVSYSKDNNGFLLIVSGRDENDLILKTTQRYNVNTNIWDTLNPHPTGLLGGATTVLKDSLYIVGGVVNPPGSGQDIVYKFSINENVWSTVGNFPIAIVDSKAVSYQDSLIYTSGGFGGANEGIVFVYNAVTNSWRQATSFPSLGRRNFGGFAITGDTLIYMCGTAAFGSSSYFDSVYVGVINQLDRSVISWTRGRNFPGQTRTFFDANSWGNRGIIMTGGSIDNTFNTSSNECYSFSPGRNEWTRLPDKPSAWLTGQSGTVKLSNNIWKLICASGYNNGYLSVNEILSDTLLSVGMNNIYNEIPEKFSLHQNYPNPFNPNTIIPYIVIENHFVSLKVYDILSNEVETLVEEKQNPGSYTVEFDGNNLPSGIYFYKIEIDGVNEVKKMILSK